jgi:hypothetical protein
MRVHLIQTCFHAKLPEFVARQFHKKEVHVVIVSPLIWIGAALLVKCSNISSPSRFAMSPLIIASRNSRCFNNVSICRLVGYLDVRKHREDKDWGVRDEFCVFSASEVFEIFKVIHERLIFEKLGLGEDYHQFAREAIQFRYCGFERDCKNSRSASKRRRSRDSVMAKELKSMRMLSQH